LTEHADKVMENTTGMLWTNYDLYKHIRRHITQYDEILHLNQL